MESGLLGYFDAARGCAVSPVTRSSEHMAAIRIPYACKLLFQVCSSFDCQPSRRVDLASLDT